VTAALSLAAPAPVQAPSSAPLVIRRCACGGSPGVDGECAACRAKRLQRSPLRSPLEVAPAGDAHEREAERVADRVSAGPSLQRQGEDGPEAPAPAAPAGPAPAAPAAPCTPAPVATLVAFNNSGTTAAENCCALCPQNLGVSPDGTAVNGMEMQIRIADPCPGSEYDILRVRETWMWQRVGGAWTELEHQGPGENDDHHSDDECLRLRRGRFLYVIDEPGWPGTALPAPVGHRWSGVTGVTSDAAATDVVAQDTFAEWVNYRNRAAGIDWTPISSPRFFYWRSVLWLTQDAGGWHMGADSEVERGFRRAVVRP
jgi:hypothetical protein